MGKGLWVMWGESRREKKREQRVKNKKHEKIFTSGGLKEILC
jgi:hypothetical protein